MHTKGNTKREKKYVSQLQKSKNAVYSNDPNLAVALQNFAFKPSFKCKTLLSLFILSLVIKEVYTQSQTNLTFSATSGDVGNTSNSRNVTLSDHTTFQMGSNSSALSSTKHSAFEMRSNNSISLYPAGHSAFKMGSNSTAVSSTRRSTFFNSSSKPAYQAPTNAANTATTSTPTTQTSISKQLITDLFRKGNISSTDFENPFTEVVTNSILTAWNNFPKARPYMLAVLESENFTLGIDLTEDGWFGGYYNRDLHQIIFHPIGTEFTIPDKEFKEKNILHEFWHAYNSVINRKLNPNGSNKTALPFGSAKEMIRFKTAYKEDFDLLENFTAWLKSSPTNVDEKNQFKLMKNALNTYPLYKYTISLTEKEYAALPIKKINQKIRKKYGYFESFTEIKKEGNSYTIIVRVEDKNWSFIQAISEIVNFVRTRYKFNEESDKNVEFSKEVDAYLTQEFHGSKIEAVFFKNLQQHHEQRREKAFPTNSPPSQFRI